MSDAFAGADIVFRAIGCFLLSVGLILGAVIACVGMWLLHR